MGVDRAAAEARWAHPVTLARPVKRAYQSFVLLKRGDALREIVHQLLEVDILIAKFLYLRKCVSDVQAFAQLPVPACTS